MLALAVSTACSRKPLRAPAIKSPKPDNSYVDLEAGWKVRIVVPLFKSGGFRVSDSARQMGGATISISADDFIGYSVYSYAVKHGRKGRVRLEFVSADITRYGKTILAPKPSPLPFQLPRGTGHIRLIYLVRLSRADHNMAIVASKKLTVLNAFTARLLEDPSACATVHNLFCSWVPAGIALRPEKP